MHPESAASSSLWVNIPTRGSQWVMGIVGSPDIFQSKMLEITENLEYVQAYLDNLLCISRSSLEDHLKKLEEVLRRLCNTRLKVNAEKSTFCALEIEYLGYILTRDGIKPQSNKVQAILAIQPPQNVWELRHFLGMLQYYGGLWARQSKMLAPLTSLVGECGQTKASRAKGTKKAPWHWDGFIKELLITQRLSSEEE
jgi:hypothetical protein